MSPRLMLARLGQIAAMAACLTTLWAQDPNQPPPGPGGPPDQQDFDGPPEGGPGFGGPPPFGGGGFGGPGAMQDVKLVKQFDLNKDGWLNAAERKAAREKLNSDGGGRRMGGPGGFRPFGGQPQTAQPGPKLAPKDVPSFPGAPLYATNILRTFFLEFENADWEKELADFKSTDVDVPARLTVDGKTYPDVGVQFHGMSSYMMVGEGQKRSLVLTMDLAHEKQDLGGYRKLALLNSHEDASFLHTVLAMQVARDYLPAPKANLVRVVINGECWGVYVSQQHFDKAFLRDNFGTTEGTRWKASGSPGGAAGFRYLGDEAAPYKRLYEIKSKDLPKAWADLAHLCKVLNETPADQLEKALAPVLDIEGALKFLAWENALANGDGFYARASDYSLYEDPSGKFHILPYDANECFSAGGGPGGPGGRGGFGGRGGGPGGPGGFGPGMFLGPQLFAQADKDQDGKLTAPELDALAATWFTKLDPSGTGQVNQAQFTEHYADLLPASQGFGPNGGDRDAGRGGRGGFGPAQFLGPVLFTPLDQDKNGSLTQVELQQVFQRWFGEWDKAKAGSLDLAAVRDGLNSVLPSPNFGGGPGGEGGGRGGRGRGGFGGPGGFGGFGGGGTELDPLANQNDTSKPLLSKLLAVPALRAKYLGYVRDIAEKWLDWNRLGPVATQYHNLIADAVKADTRKLDSTEEFEGSVDGAAARASLKAFAEKRRAYLLNHAEIKKLAP